VKELLTPEEVSKLLKVDPATVRTWLRDGKLEGFKLAGGGWRISEEQIEAYLQDRRGGRVHDKENA
jgi:excisionase family DNA binding protein